MLHLYQSNRLEYLAAMLARVQAACPLSHALVPEEIVIQSQGMRRYISHFLAQHNGIAANLRFSLPASLVWRLMRHAAPDTPELSPFASEVMRWRLLQLFVSDEFAQDDAFQAARNMLAHYLNNGDYAAYQLAGQLADVFDQYLVYRPQWVESWAADKIPDALVHDTDAMWQAQLWRYLDDGKQGVPHRVQLWRNLMQRLAEPNEWLPERFLVFGIATLAPMYLKLLEHMAQHSEIHIFALNPSAEYWGDILEPAQIVHQPELMDVATSGYPLLASLGKQGRDFFNELAEMNVHTHIQSFDDTAVSGSLLHSIQHHIQTQTLPEVAAQNGWLAQHQRYLTEHVFPMHPEWRHEFQAALTQPEARVLAQLSADESVQIHSAHSPLRELQILKDRLLTLLQQHPTWQPHDIAVLTPHIEPYAPYIDAVFGSDSGSMALPYTLSDIKLSRHQNLLDALEQTLHLLNSRFESEKLLSLLDNELILQKFSIQRDDLPLLHDTVQRLNIRWGSDAAERAQHGDRHNLFTWQQGLERMILGFMLPENTRGQLWQNRAAYTSHPEHLAVLSCFATLVRLLATTKRAWQTAASVAQWCERIRQLLAQLITVEHDDDRAAAQQLEHTLSHWQDEAHTAQFSSTITREIALAHLIRFLASQTDAGFLRGGITFCGMVPMRSLPFKVVCLLGLNDGDFPRNTRAAPFDLIARYPQKGDRARRDDDRYLFLEAILSARNVLYLSFVGKDIRTDEPRSPSTLLSELVDVVATLTCVPSSLLMRDWLITHPLHAFSARYFSGSLKLTSMRQDYANALNLPQPPFAPFVNILPDTVVDSTAVTQRDFYQFWRNPLRTWLYNELNWQSPYVVHAYESHEPFSPDQPRLLDEAYFRAYQNGQDFDQLAQHLTAQSLLPAGELGMIVRQDYARRTKMLCRDWVFSTPLPHQSGTLDLGDSGCLNYQLTHLHEHGQILHAQQFLQRNTYTGKLRDADKIELLLRHLVHCAIAHDVPLETHYLSVNQSFSLPEIDRDVAQETLALWLAAYQQGQHAPLAFFPRVNLAAATVLLCQNKATWSSALDKASQIYHAGYKGMPQADYPEVKLVYGRNADEDLPYRSEAFRHLTENLFKPLKSCLAVLRRD